MMNYPQSTATTQRSGDARAAARDVVQRCDLLDRNLFLRMLTLERKRAERSGRLFALMLVERTADAAGDNVFRTISSSLCKCTRDTDIKGWYEEGRIIGVIFTEIGTTAEAGARLTCLKERMTQELSAVLSLNERSAVHVRFHVYPESSGSGSGGQIDLRLYPEIGREAQSRRCSRAGKRLLDIIGSSIALLIFSPILLAIAGIVRLTSPGPALFRQQRVGQYGDTFTFLKFRTMHVANDPTIHKQYVERLIAGSTGAAHDGSVYKITDDPRITRIGRWLRRSSLDELPQFFNVLSGEMSLVGPRPPIPYEFAYYQPWHRARLITVKPGITGLWQVRGRSKTTFDDMVRLDLQYAMSWSVWLDLTILWQTPRAVLSRDGAY